VSAAMLPAPGEPNGLYIVDLSSKTRAQWATIRPTIVNGERVELVRAFLGWLARLIEQQQPAYITIAGDAPRTDGEPRYWQNELWDGYKADRVPTPPEYNEQLSKIRGILELEGMPVLQRLGYQADDAIARTCAWAREPGRGLRVVIVTRDHDLWSLCDPTGEVIVFDGEHVIGADEMFAKYKVPPAKMLDYLALTGDGDEAPGVRGIGPAAAAKLLGKRADLDDVFRNALLEAPKLRDMLLQGEASARLSRKLVALRTDFDLPPDAMHGFNGRWDTAARSLRGFLR
jgi:DNA polymerase I